MQLIRTTLRIQAHLKKAAEKEALEKNMSLQDVFNRALEDFLNNTAVIKARKVVFKTHDLGTPLDNLKRNHYYSNP